MEEKRRAYEEGLQRETVEAYDRYKRVEVKCKVRAAKSEKSGCAVGQRSV